MRLPGSTASRSRSSVTRVAVATDRSATADHAVTWAAELAERYEAELVIVQVLAEPDPEARDGLAELARTLGAPDARLEVVVDADAPGAIVRAAEEAKADVLVVGNVGMSGRKEFLLGNVPNRVSHNARCTVVIVNTSEAAERSGGRFFRRSG
jgi:nucleotide-binding universal stress UspA family protein